MLNKSDCENISIGQRLKKLREKGGFSQIQLADIIGVNNKTYSKYENDITLFSIDVLTRLAKHYETTTDFILTGRKFQVEEKFSVLLAGHNEGIKEDCYQIVRLCAKLLSLHK